MFQQKPLLGRQINWTHPLARGLVACWVMNEGGGNKIYDLSGNGNHGTCISNPEWIAGRTGHLLKFDGTAAYVETSKLVYTFPMTISVWAKHDDGTTSAHMFYDGPSDGWGMDETHLSVLSGQLAFYIRSDGTHIIDERTLMAMDTLWHHYVVVLAPYTRILVDNVSVYSASYTGTPNFAGDPVYGSFKIAKPSDPERWWPGLIDGISIYNRILTLDEIAWLYREPYAMFKNITFEPSIWDAGIGSINIGDSWKDIENIQVNIGDVWKDYSQVQLNISDAWKNTS